MKHFQLIVSILLIAAGLNWGLIAAFHVNYIDQLFGGSAIDTVLYLCFGAAALWKIFDIVPIKIVNKVKESQ